MRPPGRVAMGTPWRSMVNFQFATTTVSEGGRPRPARSGVAPPRKFHSCTNNVQSRREDSDRLETRANLKAVLDRVVADKAPIQIVRPKGEGVVLVSESEWEGMLETMHLLSSPENARQLMERIARFDAGEGEEHELIRPGRSRSIAMPGRNMSIGSATIPSSPNASTR